MKCVRSQRERENTDLSTQLKMIAANYNGQLASGPCNRIEEIGGTAKGNYTVTNAIQRGFLFTASKNNPFLETLEDVE